VLSCRVDDALLVLLARAPAAGSPAFSHAQQLTSTAVDVCRQQA
jgi:hypothetical protein